MTSRFLDANGVSVQRIPVSAETLLSGENQTDDRLYGGSAPASASSKTASAAVKASAGKYYGYIVTVALSAAAVTIYDNTSATGTVIDVIPASAAAGTRGVLPAPVPCANGIYASFGGTGTVVFLFT